MFHRVKSEGQDEQQAGGVKEAPRRAIGNAEETERTSAVLQQQQPVGMESAKPEKVDAEPAAQIQTPNPEKDVQTMNQISSSNSADTQGSGNETQTASVSPASAYQRQPLSRPVGGGYPGSSYPGYGAQSREPAASAGDRRLTIGAGITMSGEIECCDYLLVEGTVEAALKGANFLDVAESGVFYGTVEIEEAVISGRFEGDITVHGRLTIAATGTITGSIAYKELEVESGAVIDGKLTPLQASQAESSNRKPQAASSAKPGSAAAKAREAKSGVQDSQSRPAPANTDGELFGKATVAAE